MEMSPSTVRTFVVGTTYQLGNLASSASATIEARLSERFPLPPGAKGTKRYEYGKVICIFLGCVSLLHLLHVPWFTEPLFNTKTMQVYLFVIFLAFIGPEYRNRNMDDDSDDY
jgi:SHS family lactate transporter-like MFS transporter